MKKKGEIWNASDSHRKATQHHIVIKTTTNLIVINELITTSIGRLNNIGRPILSRKEVKLSFTNTRLKQRRYLQPWTTELEIWYNEDFDLTGSYDDSKEK